MGIISKADGTPVWKNVNGFDSKPDPYLGYAARRYVNKVVDGYIVSVRSVWRKAGLFSRQKQEGIKRIFQNNSFLLNMKHF